MSADDTLTMEDGAVAAPSEAWAPGGTIGRFVVLGSLGSGGMGLVLSAWDPALDRKVAIKLLRPERWEKDGRTRLEREAQAMARVQHPNVAAVYEVGSVGEQAFVAMELVEGRTLKSWLSESARGVGEVVAMFLAAGRGLWAVHAAGIVHRDFKPDNVLVGGDGRPRVSDFGLVSLAPAGHEASSVTTSFGGTPAYMSPEQLSSAVADARSDQFSFCVSLWEALYGARPFADDAPASARHAPERPPAKKVPAWLRDVVARGLQANPDDRWPSMEALLQALSHDPAAIRRRWLGRASLVALVLACAVAFKLAHDQARTRCGGAAERLAGVWDADVAQALSSAFAAGGAPTETWQRTRALVDRYAHRWVATHEEACRATRVEGRQSEAMLDLRMACLERRRATLQAVVELWKHEKLDGQNGDRAVSAAASLPDLEDCSDLDALAAPLPPPRDPAEKARLAAVRAKLDRLHALMATGDEDATLAAAQALQDEAAATHYPPVEAEAKYLLGVALDHLVKPGGEAALIEAARLAAEAHDDSLTTRALSTLASVYSEAEAKYDQALLVATLAETALARAGNPPKLRGYLLWERAIALRGEGDTRRARAVITEAHRLLAQVLGEDNSDTLAALSLVADIADDEGDYAGAVALQQKVLDAVARVLGPDSVTAAGHLEHLALYELDHEDFVASERDFRRALTITARHGNPDNERVAEIEEYLCDALFNLDRLDEAAVLCQTALERYLRVDGPEHAYTSAAYVDLALVRAAQNRTDEALPLVRRGLEIGAKTYGGESSTYGLFEASLGDVLKKAGDTRGAREAYATAYELTRKTRGADHPVAWSQLLSRAQLDAENGHCREVREDLVHARDALAKRFDHENDVALAALGRCDLELGRTAEARDELERAVAWVTRSPNHSTLGGDRFLWAKALAADGDRARARTEALEAERELAAQKYGDAKLLRELRDWLRRRS